MPYESGKIEAGDTFSTETRFPIVVRGELKYYPVGIERIREAERVTPQRVYAVESDPYPAPAHIDKGRVDRIRISLEAHAAMRVEQDSLKDFFAGLQDRLKDFLARMDGDAAAAVEGHNHRMTGIMDGEPYIYDHHAKDAEDLSDPKCGVSIGMIAALRTISTAETDGDRNAIRVIDLVMRGGRLGITERIEVVDIQKCVVAGLAEIQQRVSGARAVVLTDLGEEWRKADQQGTVLKMPDIEIPTDIHKSRTWWDDLGATEAEQGTKTEGGET